MKLPEPVAHAWMIGGYFEDAITPHEHSRAEGSYTTPLVTLDACKQAIRDALEEAEFLLRDDKYAITFQTMSGYRNGVLKNIRAMKDEIK